MTHYLFIIIGAVLVNNVVLVKILGLCPFMGVSKKLKPPSAWARRRPSCSPSPRRQLRHRPLPAHAVRAGIPAHVVVHRHHRRYRPDDRKWSSRNQPGAASGAGIYLPLITTNCAVLGVPLLNVANKHNFPRIAAFRRRQRGRFSLVLVLSPASERACRRRRRARPFPRRRHRHGHRRPDEPRSWAFAGLDRTNNAFSHPHHGAGRRRPRRRARLRPRSSSRSKATRWSRRSTPSCRRRSAASAASRLQTLRRSHRRGRGEINLARRAARKASASWPTCSGASQTAQRRENPKQVAIIDEQTCIGCTLCIQACPVDAIVGAAKQMHTIVASLCTGCELCVKPCPVECITMEGDPREPSTTGSGSTRSSKSNPSNAPPDANNTQDRNAPANSSSSMGGVKPDTNKTPTVQAPIGMPIPKLLVVPLHQSIGGIPNPLVAAGERVLKGQKSAVRQVDLVGCPRPTSGMVIAVEERIASHPSGLPTLRWSSNRRRGRMDRAQPVDYATHGPEKVREILRDYGVVGLGGAVFPSHAKLTPAKAVPMDARHQRRRVRTVHDLRRPADARAPREIAQVGIFRDLLQAQTAC